MLRVHRGVLDLRAMDTDVLLSRAADGDATVLEPLFESHRARLRAMVGLRIDPRIAIRTDPSDIVQEVLFEAHRRLPDYLRTRPMPFYPWLRQLACQRLVTEHRKHVRSKSRTVLREQEITGRATNQPAMRLSQILIQRGGSPSDQLAKSEDRKRVVAALCQLTEDDREILILRLVEQLSTKETAAVLEIAEGTVGSRQFRALQRLKKLLETGD